MKHLVIMFAALLCLCFTACKKDWETPKTGAQKYQLEKLTGVFEVQDTLRFYYNWKGNPDSIKRSYNNYLQNQVRFFYDSYGRITDVAQYWEGRNWFETWHHYTYAGNKIMSDSTYEFGDIGPGFTAVPPPHRTTHYLRRVTTLEWDHKDRIVKENIVYGFNDSRYHTYTYNAQGNLAAFRVYANGVLDYENTYTYGAAKSMASTHPIWQLLSRDFSVNSRYYVTQTNNFGLPVVFAAAAGHGGYFFYDINAFSGEVKATYKKR